jgi:hypothetical protein
MISIMQSLLPFWAFPPADLAKRNLEAEKVVETFTLILTNGRVELQVSRLCHRWRRGGADDTGAYAVE